MSVESNEIGLGEFVPEDLTVSYVAVFVNESRLEKGREAAKQRNRDRREEREREMRRGVEVC